MKELGETSHFFRQVCGNNAVYFFKNFGLKRIFEPQHNLPGVLLETSEKKNITLFPSFTAAVVYGVSLLFILLSFNRYQVISNCWTFKGRLLTIHVKLNRYLYVHETYDHQTGHQVLFFMTTYGLHGNNFQFLTIMVANFIGDNFLGVNFLGVIFLWAISKRTIFRGGDLQRRELSQVGIFIRDNFNRRQFPRGQFTWGTIFTELFATRI